MQVAASLPVVGLPVPEQQVSKPVPRGQREHLLLQFDHGAPLQSPETETDITANRTSTPRRWTPQNQLRSSSFCYSKRRLITNTFIRLMAPSSTSPPKQENQLLSFLAPVTMQLYFSSRWGNRSRMFFRRCVGEAPLLLWQLREQLVVSPASSLPELRMDALAANV